MTVQSGVSAKHRTPLYICIDFIVYLLVDYSVDLNTIGCVAKIVDY